MDAYRLIPLAFGPREVSIREQEGNGSSFAKNLNAERTMGKIVFSFFGDIATLESKGVSFFATLDKLANFKSFAAAISRHCPDSTLVNFISTKRQPP